MLQVHGNVRKGSNKKPSSYRHFSPSSFSPLPSFISLAAAHYSSSTTAFCFAGATTACFSKSSASCSAVVAFSIALSSRTLMNLGKRIETPRSLPRRERAAV